MRCDAMRGAWLSGARSVGLRRCGCAMVATKRPAPPSRRPLLCFCSAKAARASPSALTPRACRSAAFASSRSSSPGRPLQKIAERRASQARPARSSAVRATRVRRALSVALWMPTLPPRAACWWAGGEAGRDTCGYRGACMHACVFVRVCVRAGRARAAGSAAAVFGPGRAAAVRPRVAVAVWRRVGCVRGGRASGVCTLRAGLQRAGELHRCDSQRAAASHGSSAARARPRHGHPSTRRYSLSHRDL